MSQPVEPVDPDPSSDLPAPSGLPMPPPPAVPPPPPAATAERAERPVVWAVAAGAVVAALSTMMAWFDVGGVVRADGFDVPFVFLFDRRRFDDSAFTIGAVLVGLAALALLAAFVPAARTMGRIMGVLIIAIGAAFGAQLIGLANESFMSITDLSGLGPAVAIAGGVTVLVTSRP